VRPTRRQNLLRAAGEGKRQNRPLWHRTGRDSMRKPHPGTTSCWRPRKALPWPLPPGPKPGKSLMGHEFSPSMQFRRPLSVIVSLVNTETWPPGYCDSAGRGYRRGNSLI